jgi:GTPase Era involved in 16S rRNA processing
MEVVHGDERLAEIDPESLRPARRSMTAAGAIGTLREVAIAAGAPELAAEAESLGQRAREQRFYVACVGGFKRGKSSLINALVGQPVLPTGVIPVTSVSTILRHGPTGARVLTRTGWATIAIDDLAKVVTEQENPANIKNVQAVEVLLPAVILRNGLCLVDTPGVGSVSDANTATVHEFVSQIDAALVVLGADPPITGDELRLLEAIAGQTDKLLFVLNKADRVTGIERDEATRFLRGVLSNRLGRSEDRVYQVSSVGAGAGPDRTALVERLQALASGQRESLSAHALQRGVRRLRTTLVGLIREQLHALTRPVAASARRAEELRELTATVDRALRELRPLFAAEEDRLSNLFATRAQQFVQASGPEGLAAIDAAWGTGQFDRGSRTEGLEYVNRLARDLLDPWLARAESRAEADYRQATHRFVTIANEFLAQLVASAGPGTLAAIASDSDALHFRIRRHFAFADRMHYHYPIWPWRSLIDAVVPASVRRRRRQGRARDYFIDLLMVNSSRVVGDLSERVRESRREIEAEIRATLATAARSAADALEWAQAVRERGEADIRGEQDRLEALLREADGIATSATDGNCQFDPETLPGSWAR